MGITPILVKSKGSQPDFEVVPSGAYLARCYRMVNEGTHKDEYAGSKFEAKPTKRLILSWELLQDDVGEEVRMEDGRPFSVQKTYTDSLHPKSVLRKDLNAWRGENLTEEQAKEFEITKVLGKFCMIQVVHEPSKDGEKVYAKVGAIMSTKRGKDVVGVNDLLSFTVDAPDQENFDTFSEWLQNRINTSDEMKNNPMVSGARPERSEKSATVATVAAQTFTEPTKEEEPLPEPEPADADNADW